jgi:hypothetical protein
MALTKEGIAKGVNNDNDYIHLFIEIPNENKIQINELQVSKFKMPPYKFEYKMIQWREYIHRDEVYDPIK